MKNRELDVKKQLEGMGRKFGLKADVKFIDEKRSLRPPFLCSISTRLPGKFEIPRYLVELLERDELVAAFLHEVAHVKFKHFLKNMLIIVISSLLVLGVFRDWNLFILTLVGMSFPALWFQRQFEIKADLFAARNSSPHAMISVLEKVTKGGESKDCIYRLTHPRVEDRIRNLEREMEN